jgi:hypothetical protein
MPFGQPRKGGDKPLAYYYIVLVGMTGYGDSGGRIGDYGSRLVYYGRTGYTGVSVNGNVKSKNPVF